MKVEEVDIDLINGITNKVSKIYFAPNWNLTSEQMISDYIKQTPSDSGQWKNIEVVTNPSDAEYLIIQDNCDISLFNQFPKENRLYFSRNVINNN